MARTHRALRQADAGPRPQQDPGRPAVLRVPGVLPGQRRRVLRQLLRLLPAGGLPPALGHLHREGQQPERGDRPAPPRGHPRAVRAAGRDHRRVRLVHLRPGRAGGLRRHRAPAPGRRAVPAGCGPAPPGGPPVPAQRRVAHPGEVPRPRRHPGDRPGLVGDHRPGGVLRRRGGADHGAGPADRRAAGRAQGAQRLPGHALRDAEGQARPGRSLDIEAEMEARVGQMEAEGRALEAARLRQRTTFDLEMLRELGYCTRRRELLAAPVAAGARLPAVDAAGLLPAGLAADGGRVAHDDPAGGRHVQERPDPQGDPGRLRLPAPVRAGQPAADLRGVRGARQPGRSTSRPRPARTSTRRASGSWSSWCGPPGSSTRRSPSAPRRVRSTISWRRSGAASSAASAPWSPR